MKRFLNDIVKYNSYAVYSAKSELKAEVASSYLNWIWWILEPVCFMLIYTFIFGYVFKVGEMYFPVFVYVGLTIWDFFNKNVKVSVRMVKKNKGIISKVYIPKFVLIETKMMVHGFKMLISSFIIVILMIGYHVPVTWNILYIFPLIIILVIFNYGIMCILLHYGVYVTDLSNVVNILLRLVFYLTGIFYSIETRVGKNYPEIAELLEKWNPIAFIISSARKCILYGERPSGRFMLLWFIIGLMISVIGTRIIYKNENSYVKVI